MPFSGSGTFTRVYSWVTDKANGLKISASRMDTEFDGIATGLSNCITKDGQTTLTADIPFFSRKITGLGNATADTDAMNRVSSDTRYIRQLYLTDNSGQTAAGGTANALTFTTSQTVTSLSNGLTLAFTAAATNTGAATLNVNSIGAKAIVRENGTALAGNELVQGGVYRVVYLSASDHFRMIGSAFNHTIAAATYATNSNLSTNYATYAYLDANYYTASYISSTYFPKTGGTISGQLDIASGQNLVVNNGIFQHERGGAGIAYIGYYNRGSDSGTLMRFARIGTTVGSIDVASGTTTYNTSSDKRIKTNIVAAPDYGALIDAANVVEFSMIGDEEDITRTGFLAQDLHPLFPTAVKVGSGEPGQEDFVPWAVDLSKLVPVLWREVQSLRARVAALEGTP